MEDIFYSESDSENDIVITPQAKQFLSETAKWTKFLSVLGFIGLGIMLIVLFFAVIVGMGDRGVGIAKVSVGEWIFILILTLIMTGIYVMPLYYLLQFSNKARIAVESNDTDSMTKSLGFLKSHYKYVGILVIVFLVFYALAIVIKIYE